MSSPESSSLIASRSKPGSTPHWPILYSRPAPQRDWLPGGSRARCAHSQPGLNRRLVKSSSTAPRENRWFLLQLRTRREFAHWRKENGGLRASYGCSAGSGGIGEEKV